jgi:hypothetical protein
MDNKVSALQSNLGSIKPKQAPSVAPETKTTPAPEVIKDSKFAKVLSAKPSTEPSKKEGEVKTNSDGLPILDDKQTPQDKKVAQEIKLKLISLYKAALAQITEANDWNKEWESGNGVMNESESKIHAMQTATDQLSDWKRKHGLDT